MFLVGDVYEKQRKNICFLDRTGSWDGSSGRISYPGSHADVFRNDKEAAFIASGCTVSCRMDDALYPDGNQRRTGMAVEGSCGKSNGYQCIYHAAGCEFLLESDLFQRAGLWVCIFVADFAVDSDFVDDCFVFTGGQGCRYASDSVSSVGDLCRVLKLSGMDAEPVREKMSFLFPHAVL